MSCELCKCGVSDSRFLWKCESCPKRFHAACIGVKREHEGMVRDYMIPACRECQPRASIDLNLKELIQQQMLLSEQIKIQTEVNHRSALKLQNDSVIHEALDRLDAQLEAIKNEINLGIKNCSAAATVTTIKNHVSSLFDDTMHIVKQCVTESVTMTLTDMSSELGQIGSLTREMASSFEKHTEKMHRSEPKSDILDELKALSSSISTLESKLSTPPQQSPSVNLADELGDINLNLFSSVSRTPPCLVNEISILPNKESHKELNKNLWRDFGHKRVWKPQNYWDDYDRRMKNRTEQHKSMDKARRRRQKRRKYYNRQGFTGRLPKINSDDNNKNNDNKNKNNNKHLFRNSRNNSKFPSDKHLLIASKTAFASSQPNKYRFIQFEKGDTLNPYKTALTKPSDTPPTASFVTSAPISEFACHDRTYTHVHKRTPTACFPYPQYMPSTSRAEKFSSCNYDCGTHGHTFDPVHHQQRRLVNNNTNNCTQCRQLDGADSNFMMY